MKIQYFFSFFRLSIKWFYFVFIFLIKSTNFFFIIDTFSIHHTFVKCIVSLCPIVLFFCIFLQSFYFVFSFILYIYLSAFARPNCFVSTCSRSSFPLPFPNGHFLRVFASEYFVYFLSLLFLFSRSIIMP